MKQAMQSTGENGGQARIAMFTGKTAENVLRTMFTGRTDSARFVSIFLL